VPDQLDSISPLDGRYNKDAAVLSHYFSESALMRYRLQVEVEYLIALSNEIKLLPCRQCPT
jgi:adenylosuccinate lyase